MNRIEGDVNGRGLRIAIVAARFNDLIVDSLIKGANHELTRQGVADNDIDLLRVPGAFELPVTVKKAAGSGKYDGIIAIGAVIRGGTPHFDYICSACTNGLNRVALDTDVPVSFGVLTVDTIQQALERAGTKAGNKGGEAASALLETVNVLRKID
ncbi:MAG: 6,7-dimethyl-8-ribityllumazine synthase [Pseudomonadota bacterium]